MHYHARPLRSPKVRQELEAKAKEEDARHEENARLADLWWGERAKASEPGRPREGRAV